MAKPLSHKAFIEGFPEGVIALAKQKNGKYRLIVSRPPNNPDPILADAEKFLYELIEFQDIDFSKMKKPWETGGTSDIDDDDDDDK